MSTLFVDVQVFDGTGRDPVKAEVLVEGDRFRVIREREKNEDLVRGETR